jgi:hypothetical protein
MPTPLELPWHVVPASWNALLLNLPDAIREENG